MVTDELVLVEVDGNDWRFRVTKSSDPLRVGYTFTVWGTNETWTLFSRVRYTQRTGQGFSLRCVWRSGPSGEYPDFFEGR